MKLLGVYHVFSMLGSSDYGSNGNKKEVSVNEKIFL